MGKFIKENQLSEDVATRLRTCASEVRERTIDQGWNVIDNSRNASAVVISRIRKHEKELGQVHGGPMPGNRRRSRSRSPRPAPPTTGGEMREGDWNCESCSAHNFSRREECFKCGAPKGGQKKDRNR